MASLLDQLSSNSASSNNSGGSLLNRLTNLPLRKNRREQFAEISNTNTQIVDILIDEAKRSQKARRYNEANRLIDIAQLILANNKRFQNMVGEILSKKD